MTNSSGDVASFDFRTEIDRRGTDCSQWDHRRAFFGTDELVPFGTADMDFSVAPPIAAAIARRAQHGVFGYTVPPGQANLRALLAWLKARWHWSVDPTWVLTTEDVMHPLTSAISLLSEPGDAILIQPPVYGPFAQAIARNDREVLGNPLRRIGNRYLMDFDDLRAKLRHPRLRAMILCNPHNPVGRAWTAEELRSLGTLCQEAGIAVLSDEIHGDLTLGSAVHQPFAALSEPFAAMSMTFLGVSKGFNLAGLRIAHVVVPDETLRRRFYRYHVERCFAYNTNPFGLVAERAAYKAGGAWLDALRATIADNRRLLAEILTAELPQVGLIEAEATYLAWLDARSLLAPDRSLADLLYRDAGVGFMLGERFGAEGQGYLRVNLACPPTKLERGLDAFVGAANRVARRPLSAAWHRGRR